MVCGLGGNYQEQVWRGPIHSGVLDPMLRANRLLFLALGIVAILTAAIGVWTWPRQPTLVTYGEEGPRSSQYLPGGARCDPKAIAVISDVAERLRQADVCKKETEEYRLSTNDLIQQTRAANAARAQANIASQQLRTGWLQTLGGFLTLAAAVGAAIYARQAANHTREANGIARDSAIKQLRPYLYCTKTTCGDGTTDVGGVEVQSLTYQAFFQNFGETPAKDVVASLWWRVDDKNGNFVRDRTFLPVSFGDIPPNFLWDFDVRLLDNIPEIKEEIWERGARAYFGGRIDYKSPDGEDHHSDFKWFSEGRWFHSHPMRRHNDGNTST